MARRLDVSPSYINLLERNQRSLSLPLLIKLCDAYDVAPEHFSEAQEMNDFAELRRVFDDPLFGEAPVDAAELRLVAESGAQVSAGVRRLYGAYQAALGKLQAVARSASDLTSTPEHIVETFMNERDLHFPEIEDAAAELNDDPALTADRLYQRLKDHAASAFDLAISVRPVEEMGETVRYFDRHRRRIALSEALDGSNRLFQLAHQIGLLQHDDLLNALIDEGRVPKSARAHLRLELANSFAAAVLMPYRPFLRHARETKHDIDRLCHRFSVTFEMAAIRLAALRSKRDPGLPFFMLRIDHAGNVVKRIGGSVAPFIQQGGACPLWNIHDAFQSPDALLTQTIELPDRSRYFTVSRTVHRPRLDAAHQPRRLAIALGCALNHADELIYRGRDAAPAASPTPIGPNCGLCPRPSCAHRAHPPQYVALTLDEDRRGQTRFES